MGSRDTRRGGLAAIVLALALCLSPAVPALGSVRATDTLGQRDVRSDAALRRVAPDVAATSGILTTDEGRVLWSRGPDAQRPMASTTKVMSSLVVLGQARPGDKVSVTTSDSVALEGAGVRLRVGERMTVFQLLQAMLLHSANDAAFVLGEHVGGSIPGFVSMMNTKARELGLSGTAYENPHGLDEPGHHTTARDLATLARSAMADPAFRRVVRTKYASIPGFPTSRRIENSNRLLWTMPGADGVKTGFTRRAGYCLVAHAEREGIGLYAVVLGSPTSEERFADARRLLEWGFERYGSDTLVSAEETLGPVRVSDYLSRSVTAKPATGTAAVLFDLDGEVTRRVCLPRSVKAPVKDGQRLGTVTVMQGCHVLAEVPLVSAEAVPRPTAVQRLRMAFARAIEAVLGDVPLAHPVGL